MATVIGDRDVLLLGSSSRALNPLNSGILLTTSAPAFKVDTLGNPLPSTITIKASLIGISGTVAFTASGATVTDNHDNTATLAYSSLTGNSCTITASITVNGQAFSANVTLAKVTDGQQGSAGTSGSQYATVFLYQWSSSTPSNPTGTSGYTWATATNSTYTASDGWSVTVPSNPGTSMLKLYVASVQITATAGTASTVVSYSSASVQAWTQNGATGSNGINAVTGVLTNEATTLAATSAGVVSDFSPAGGTFKVFNGATDVTGASVTYSVVSQTGCTISIAATGVYSVSAMSANQASATLQAVYGGVTIQKIVSLAKSIAGATGSTGTAAYVVISNTGQVFSRANSSASFSPASLTLTATPYGGTATYQWQYWNGSAWANVASGGTSATYTINSGDFTDTRSYRVQATINGTVYTDQTSMLQVTGGTDGINAVTGILTNEATTLAATNSGTVSDFSPAGGTFKVFSGTTDVTGASVTYSVVSQTGCAVSINTSGVYSVSSMSADQASATLQAVYGGVTIQKIISLAKSKAGAIGTAAYVSVSGTGQVFSRANSAASFSPASLVLTATPYGGSATYQWQYWTGSAWTNVASAGTSATYTVNSGDFTDSRTYRVQATISGTVYTDQITLLQVTGGTNGTNAIQSAIAQVYQWAASIPSAPAGSPTYTWSSGNISTIPSGWSSTPGTAPSQGMTLWAARVFVTDSASNATTVFNWSSSAIVAVGYSGSNGAAGPSGASYVTAYCASSTASTTTAPSQTTGKTSLPATNSGGITGTWSATVPSLTSGQYLYQSDGIYDPTTNLVTWSIPYWSSLKVGSLSAITVNTGNLTVSGTIADSGGNWSLDSNGNMTANSVALKGNIKGGDFTGYSWPTSSGKKGFYLGPEGLMLGNTIDNKYFNADQYGNVWAPQFSVVDGSATFSGTLAAGTVMSQNLSSLNATIGTLRTATSGARTEISDNVIKMYASNNVKILHIGDSSL